MVLLTEEYHRGSIRDLGGHGQSNSQVWWWSRGWWDRGCEYQVMKRIVAALVQLDKLDLVEGL